MHLRTPALLLTALASQVSARLWPQTSPNLDAPQVFQTTDQLPLANPGHITAHDPNVLKHGDHYYLFKGGWGVSILKSKDMSGPWEEVGRVLDDDSVIEKGNRSWPWAPTTIEKNGLFYCYYAVSQQGSRNSAVGVATTTDINRSGWHDHGALINTGFGDHADAYPFTVTNAIDPAFITDEHNKSYLIYGSFWDGIWKLPLSDDLLSIKNPSEPEAVQLVYLPDLELKPIEGAWMSYRDGYYYTWFSHGECCDLEKQFPNAGQEYSIRVGRSKSVNGPFVDRDNIGLLDGGGTIVYGSNHGIVYAPGGLGVVSGHGSKRDILYYHYLNTTIGFEFEKAHLGWNALEYEDGWPVVVDGVNLEPTTSSPDPNGAASATIITSTSTSTGTSSSSSAGAGSGTTSSPSPSASYSAGSIIGLPGWSRTMILMGSWLYMWT
ncbi:Glycoside hydrolase family 43 [Penicillium alfredii]|uniref:Glycoside hydrolase family 43 n=1 Tax=Penicillium alfredii TaxID=1506179 RepID=A0A9W9GAR7_9EURO|nr:Glycoside hydrolase family 43 [Penicillium alfredii]KAJ5115054.1 Glycoside hydrolase family 43 [Penicillium alfredii]